MTAEPDGALIGARRSPLAAWASAFDAVAAGVRIVEVPFRSQVDVRLPSGSAAAEAYLGVALPQRPNTFVRHDDLDVLWLGPDEWLILGPDDGVDPEAGLRAALGDATTAITDVSAQRTIISLRGPDARAVLAAGCSIDLDPRVTPAGSCVQTLLARAGIIVLVHDDVAQDFSLLVRASFAGYVADWLIDAACAD